MASLTLLLASLLPLVTSQFIPPEAILQAGYPAGFRAFVPDFPGCQQFAFHGKINSPFTEDNELGSIFQDVLRPQNGFWIVQDFKLILTPGDIIHYWTTVVKDGIAYPKHNQTWKVPGPEESVDILSPIKPPKKNPEKVKETEPSPTEDETTPKIETPSTSRDATASTNSDTTAPTNSDETASTNIDETTPSSSETSTSTSTPTTTNDTNTSTTPQTSPLTTKLNPTTVQTTTSTQQSPPTTTQTPSSTMKSTTTTAKTTTTTTTTPPPPPTTTSKKLPTSEKRETPSPKNAANSPPAEEIEELTTPFSPERPLSSAFPEEPPEFPFPGLYPRPFKPMMPSGGPGFEICSNPWNFEERIGESRTQKLERQVAKLQCQLALFQRGYNQLSNTVESEMTDLKKLMYGMVSRMASLESVLRATPFG